MNVARLHIIIMFCLGTLFGTAQVKIGENLQSIDGSSLLELESANRVLVITRVTNDQMNAITPLNGAVVYNIDASCIFVYAEQQWRNLCDSNGNISVISENGLSISNGNTIRLGGSLTQPTTIETNATNTLTISGLEPTNDPNAMVVLLDDNNTLTKASLNSLVQKEESIVIASQGQNQFITPQSITDINKIDVYRNGVKISFRAIGPNLIELQPEIICLANDEIRIVQTF